jgi:DNA end-binding protein Ku
MRAIWSGVLSFGLINIPIKLFSVTAGTELSLNYLHKTDLSPIRYAKVCRKDGKELSQEDLVKGYEYQEGDYVVLTKADFDSADMHRTQAIDVLDFVKEEEIDTIYFEKPYYLEPDKGAGKAYTILRDSLKKSKKVGVAKFVLHNREHLAILKPHENYLVLEQIRFEDELKVPEKLDLEHGEVRPKEISMALELIEHLTEKFNPEDYKDTYRAKLDKLIKDKMKGKKIKPNGTKPHPTKKSEDLMFLLKESLERTRKDQPMAQA